LTDRNKQKHDEYNFTMFCGDKCTTENHAEFAVRKICRKKGKYNIGEEQNVVFFISGKPLWLGVCNLYRDVLQTALFNKN
jgi:hypothetical protein